MDLSVGVRNATGKDGYPERLPANFNTPRRLPSAWYALAWVGEPRCSTAIRLWSAPKIFSAVADALLCVVFHRGISSAIHYLDDFLFCGAASFGKCAQNLASALTKCQDMGVPVAEHKTQGLSTVLAFLGIEIDTVHMQLRLPSEKLARLQNVLLSWSTRREGRRGNSCL